MKALTEYSNLEQSVIRRVQRVAERVLSKPTTTNITQRRNSYSEDIQQHSKRRATTNSGEAFVQAMIDELNFSQYKSAFIALVDYYDLPVRGYESMSLFSTDSERRLFLKNFAESYYQKLHWER